MEVNVYISCHVHVRAVRSGRAAIELWAVRKGCGYTNNEHLHAHLQDQIALKTDNLTDPKLQLLSHAVSNLDLNNFQVVVFFKIVVRNYYLFFPCICTYSYI